MKGASAAGGIRKERSSNLELLRLLAMFCIVANHLVGQGDVLRDAFGVNFLFSFFVGNAARTIRRTSSRTMSLPLFFRYSDITTGSFRDTWF